MFPLRDNIPRIRKPYVVWSIMAVNALAFFFVAVLPESLQTHLLYMFGAIPSFFSHLADPDTAGFRAEILSTAFSYMFLHGGLFHFLFNMWVLWIFADNVEDALGHARFVVFYLCCGVLAMAVHVLINPDSQVPIVGASGAIAGVMGAYTRLFPKAVVTTMVPLFIIPLVFDLPAKFFLLLWLAVQLLSALAAGPMSGGGGGVAFWAHIGGFLAGLVLVKPFVIPKNCIYCYLEDEKRYERE